MPPQIAAARAKDEVPPLQQFVRIIDFEVLVDVEASQDEGVGEGEPPAATGVIDGGLKDQSVQRDEVPGFRKGGPKQLPLRHIILPLAGKRRDQPREEEGRTSQGQTNRP